MMSGLRSQREKTITCVSPRSGIASVGIWRMDHTPHAQAAATMKKIRYLLRTERAIRRSIMLAIRLGHIPRFILFAGVFDWIRLEVLHAGVRAEAECLAVVLLL